MSSTTDEFGGEQPENTADTGSASTENNESGTANVKTLTHQQTGKKHIANYLVDLPEGKQAIHCYCSYTLQTSPVEETVDLDDDDLCQMCVGGYIEDVCKQHDP